MAYYNWKFYLAGSVGFLIMTIWAFSERGILLGAVCGMATSLFLWNFAFDLITNNGKNLENIRKYWPWEHK